MSFPKRIVKNDKHMNNGRINIISAIIFLIGLALIFRLYYLQVIKGGYYKEVANNQHGVSSKLEPDRGKIYIVEKNSSNGESLFPVAFNKDFAMVYAVPAKIENPRIVAEQLYSVFDQDKIEKEVDAFLENDTKSTINNEIKQFSDLEEDVFNKIKSELLDKYNVRISGEEYIKDKERQRAEEISKRKDIIVEDYFKKLNKPDDPYEPIAQKVDEAVLQKLLSLDIKGISYTMEKFRYYQEKNLTSHIIGFCGYADQKIMGRYGLEGFFQEELSGKEGNLSAERDALGGVIILNDMDYDKAVNGSDLILSIDRAIQFEACEKLDAAVRRHSADRGVVVIIEPKTGAILAMCSSPNYDPNEYQNVSDTSIYNNTAIFYQYEPGSIFKAITMAASLDLGKISPSTVYNDKGSVMIEGWSKPIKNSDAATFGGHGITDMTSVLVHSLNTGVIFAMQQIGAVHFSDYVKNFGFGEKTGIELETESEGNINNLLVKNIKPIDAAVASFGQGISVTPLQMAVSFAVLANGGKLMKPYLVKEIDYPDGTKLLTAPKEIRRVISEQSSMTVGAMLAKVVETGHAAKAKVPGYYVSGKTGTAQVANKGAKGYGTRTIHSFAGFAPTDNARFAMLVMIDDPKDVIWAESSAAPLFGEIAKFLLDYWQVPKER